MAEDSILAFLTRRRDVCIPVASICEGLGLHPDDAWSGLADLAELGLAECGAGETAVAFLTPLGAARAGLTLNDDSTEWTRAGDRRRPPQRGENGTISETDLDDGEPLLDEMADEGQETPEQEAIRAEEAEANAPERRGDYLTRPLQHPSRLLGSTAIWPLPGQPEDDGSRRLPLAEVGEGRKEGRVALYSGPCGGCGGRKLRVGDYCLACGRSGQDWLIRREESQGKAKAG